MIGERGDLLKRLDAPLTNPTGAAARLIRWSRRADERVLVMRPGGMGDLLLAQLAAERLGIDPHSMLWVVEKRSVGWADHQGLDSVVYDRSLARAAAAVASRHRLVINTEQRFGLSMSLAKLATARGGMLTAFDTNRGAHLADVLVPYDWDRTPEVLEFARLFAAGLDLRLDQNAAVRPQERRCPASGGPVLALGGVHSPSRSISAREWVAWARRLIGDQPIDVTAGPLEEGLASEVVALMGGQAVRFSGSLSQVIDKIASAERLLAIDGGPVHVASFYGVPTDVIFTAGRSQKWAPMAAGSRIHRRDDLACQPCTVFGQVPSCPIDFQCRRGIPTSLNVFEAGAPHTSRAPI